MDGIVTLFLLSRGTFVGGVVRKANGGRRLVRWSGLDMFDQRNVPLMAGRMNFNGGRGRWDIFRP